MMTILFTLATLVGSAHAAPYETTVYRYTPLEPGQITSRLSSELLSRGIPAGSQSGLGQTAVTLSQSIPLERTRLASIRDGIVAELRTRMTAIASPGTATPPAAVSASPAPPETPEPLQFNPTEFGNCVRSTLTSLKLEFQRRGNFPVLESAELNRGNGTGMKSGGIYCGKWLGALGGKAEAPREQLKLLLAMVQSTPSESSPLWVAFWAARHPRSPLAATTAGEAHEFMELLLANAAFETTFTPRQVHALPSMAAWFAQSNDVTTSRVGNLQAIRSVAGVRAWVDQAQQFAHRLMAGTTP